MDEGEDRFAQFIAEADECPNHIDAHGDRARAVEIGGRHDRAVLGENERRMAPPAMRT